MKGFFLSVAIALAMVGCATRYEKAVAKANSTPFAEQPALYKKLRDKGDISADDYKRWMKSYNAEKAEKDAVASMSPAERAKYLLWRKDVAVKEQLLAMKKNEAAAAQTQRIQSQAAADVAAKKAGESAQTAVTGR